MTTAPNYITADHDAAVVAFLTTYSRNPDRQVREAYAPGREPGGLARWHESWAARRAPRMCRLRGCRNRHYGRGLCRSHYDRWRRHGDPMGGRWPRTGPPPTPAEILAEMRAAYAAVRQAVGE
ncbi:hypothetical protein SAMN04489867_0421 [Pedococcus dokdonensis]|uniref:Uncharacterized protein n=1 Tax=Pedococcus dokdonensis TaxID=443156 RepID=A0A1H0LWP5_9MICO|nr:hypothetical protein [Pedococcus dokdonensis]SDO72565.1 hypothetical protein SAMN04489867_0421 [Pedococcus dokdonensis]